MAETETCTRRSHGNDDTAPRPRDDCRGCLEAQVRRLAERLALRYRPGEGFAWEAGLYEQLRDDPATLAGGQDAGRQAPGSRPPDGWRADVSGLLSSIEQGAADWHWSLTGRPFSAPTTGVLLDLHRHLPGHPDSTVRALVDQLARWVGQARISIGYADPPREFPDAVCSKVVRLRTFTPDGWKVESKDLGCGGHTLRARNQGADSLVWCSNEACHDSLEHPECARQGDSTWSCRRSARDDTHALTWTPTEFLALLDTTPKEEANA